MHISPGQIQVDPLGFFWVENMDKNAKEASSEAKSMEFFGLATICLPHIEES